MDLRRWLRIRPAVLITVVTFTLCLVTHAGEGASTNYFPGTYGDFAVAIAPEPGWIYANYNLFYSADADAAVLQGRVNTDLDTFAYINMPAGLFACGGRFSVSASWLHDLDATNKLESDYAVVTLGWQLGGGNK